MNVDPYPGQVRAFDEYDEHVEMSIYAMTKATRRALWITLLVSLAATITMAICDPMFDIA